MLVAFLVSPEDWYRAFWILWTLGTLVVGITTLILAARFWLVNPIIRSQRESAGRIVRAIETHVCR